MYAYAYKCTDVLNQGLVDGHTHTTHTHTHQPSHLHAQEATGTLQSFSPRIRAWLAKVSLPAEQGIAVARALEHNGYTSTDFIRGEDVNQMLLLPLFADLTPGAKAAIRRLAEAIPPSNAPPHHHPHPPVAVSPSQKR